MIRRLTLKNWRNYEDATVDFRAGTTFVVASNGVGKTSLVEAARWALFGRIAPDGTPVRAGAVFATATVELELPDLRVLVVERELVAKSSASRGTGSPPIVRLDGALVPPEELDQQLFAAYGTEPSFLVGLTMPVSDREFDKPSTLGLEAHLGRYYGIDGLRNAVERLRAMRKATDARIRKIKNANATSAQRLVQLQDNVEQKARLLRDATEIHEASQKQVRETQEQERLKANMQRWLDESIAREEAVERLAAQVSVDLHLPVTSQNLELLLDERLAELDLQIETVRIEIAVKVAKDEELAANEGHLDAAHDDCPVCRRPLDETTVALAHHANQQELASIRDSILRARSTEDDLLTQRELVKNARAQWQKIPRPGQPPQEPDANDELLPPSQLEVMAETALTTRLNAHAAHAQAEAELDQARAADQAMRELESLFRQDARLRVAIETTEETLTELLNETIHPLAVEVDNRWKELFPNRGDLTTHSDGNITRTLNERTLPYNSLSTGESMGATILLRLLVAQMATMATFCWFDEPLEHLDPDIRRKVANLLSRVTRGEGPLKQVVVTTYEEPLARHLRARDDQHVDLLDVRQTN
ncbi:ATP-binding protein [Flindersiella endophytica]